MPSETPPYERALVILVPEAEPLVAPFRLRFDPVAALGMPAHITINYPFLPGREVSEADLHRLADVFSHTAAFDLILTEIRTFPDVVYLSPEPSQPSRDLISLVASRFPESPPYGGQFPEVTPHVTVAQLKDPAQVAAVADQLQTAARGKLPVRARAHQVTLMDNRSGRWEKRAAHALLGRRTQNGAA
jgi:2'-5' RNA ligase